MPGKVEVGGRTVALYSTVVHGIVSSSLSGVGEDSYLIGSNQSPPESPAWSLHPHCVAASARLSKLTERT